MVSTRHHPRPFPPPEVASPTSARRSPQTPTSTTSSSKLASDSPPPRATTKRARGTSRKRKATITEDSEEPSLAISSLEKAAGLMSALTTLSPTRSESRPSRPKTRSQTKAQEKHTYTHTPPPLLLPWLLISLPLVIWDTGYVLGRPHTMPGGRLHSPIWTPYALYGTVDYMYGFPAVEAGNGFTSAQGTLNLLETAMYIYYLMVIARQFAGDSGFVRGVAIRSFTDLFTPYDDEGAGKVVIRGGKDLALAVLVCFAGAVMTVSKTVLYWANEVFSGFANIGHNGWARLFGIWIIPNGAWIVLPSYMIWVLGKEILDGMTGEKTVEGKNDE